MEGPLTKGVIRSIPSRTKGSSGSDSLLEVWSGAQLSYTPNIFVCILLTSYVVFLRGACLLLSGICCTVS